MKESDYHISCNLAGSDELTINTTFTCAFIYAYVTSNLYCFKIMI